MAKENYSFEENEKQQILRARDHSTPYERLLWLEETLNTFKEQILKNRALEEKLNLGSK